MSFPIWFGGKPGGKDKGVEMRVVEKAEFERVLGFPRGYTRRLIDTGALRAVRDLEGNEYLDPVSCERFKWEWDRLPSRATTAIKEKFLGNQQ